jgi:hypothetical protein
MTREVCLLEEDDIKEWIKNPNNIYTGNKKLVKNFTLQESKWQNPFYLEPNVRLSLQLYVKYLFSSGLIYEIYELKDKNIGCFCHKPRITWKEPLCNAQVLVDLLERCFHLIKDKIRKPTELITLTFGDAAENHKGMEQIGKKLDAGQGFNLDDLKKMRDSMKKLGVDCEFVSLTNELEYIEGLPNKPEAYVLVMKGAVNKLVQNIADENFNQIDLFKEQTKLVYDTKAFMYGRVVNKHARWNLCFADEDQEPEYADGKGRIVAWRHIPLMQQIREKIAEWTMDKLLNGEANYYYDVEKCGIGYHGDGERKKVFAMRMGGPMALYYQWYQRSERVGPRMEFQLNDGDMYMMSAKAVGFDWLKKKIPTLRHASGVDTFTVIKK